MVQSRSWCWMSACATAGSWCVPASVQVCVAARVDTAQLSVTEGTEVRQVGACCSQTAELNSRSE
jgi:hypothetical protein